MRPRRARAVLGAAVLAIVAGAVILAAGGGPGRGPLPPTLADAVPYDGRSPRQPVGSTQRVLLGLQRPALGRVVGLASMRPSARRAYVASLEREARALRGALEARGVRLTDVAAFERTWNGFAATVRTRDLAAISSLGVRAQPVRRFYPALSEPVATGAPPPAAAGARPVPGGPPVALLGGGVAPGPGVASGRDAVDGDDDPAPVADARDPRRREVSGTALASVLAARGVPVRPIRIAALRAGSAQPEEVATTDTLLAGLERAVDPDGDGDTSDHARVALVAVNAPYAGFAGSPEASAVAGAAGLGTLVVAPAGNEGPAKPPSGTVGSPAAARHALAVAALSGPAPRVALQLGDLRVPDAALLAGAPPGRGLPTSVPVVAGRLRGGRSALQGRLAVIRVQGDPSAQAAAAAAAGAAAVLLAETRDGRPLPSVPAGRAGVPVLGVTGEAAREVVGLDAGTRARVAGRPRLPTTGPGRPIPAAVSPFSSRGPSLAGLPKPDLAAPGAATAAGADGRPALAGGTAVAAALAAAEAARLAAAEPGASPAALLAALLAAADPGGQEPARLPASAAGTGALRRPPGLARVSARPAVPRPDRPVRLRAAAPTALALRAVPDGEAAARVAPASATTPAEVTLSVTPGGLPAGAFATGRLVAAPADAPSGASELSLPFAAPAAPPPPVPVGTLRLVRRGATVVGVRFALGSFDRGDPLGAGTAFQPAERLDLALVRADGALVRRLTPTGGARELLPAEYAYTLPGRALRSLGGGSMRFRVRASGPRQAAPTERRSEAFRRP